MKEVEKQPPWKNCQHKYLKVKKVSNFSFFFPENKGKCEVKGVLQVTTISWPLQQILEFVQA